MHAVSTPRSKIPPDACVSPLRCPSPPCGAPRGREDSVKRRALIMHSRLGCASCREKLKNMRMTLAAKSPGRVDRSPSPCDHEPPPTWPSRCFEAESIPDAIADRPRGRRANKDALLPTPRGMEYQKLRPFSAQAPVSPRPVSRERRRSHQIPSHCLERAELRNSAARALTPNSNRFPSKSDLNSCGDRSTQASQEEPHPELSPDMVSRQPFLFDGKDWSHGVCESFIKTINNARSAQNWQSLPSWAEVFAKYGSKWEPEAQPDASTPRKPSRKLAQGFNVPEHTGKRFTNAEECLRFLHAPTPFQQRQGAQPRKFTTVEECLEFLKTPPEFPSIARPAAREDAGAADARVETSSVQEADLRADEATKERAEEAAKEADRINALRRENFTDQVAWAHAVLDCESTDAAEPSSVQRCFRGLMRKLHPDRVGHSVELAQVVEVLRKAKDIAQKHISEVEPPGPPRNFQAATLCTTRGQRRIRLQWSAPEDLGRCPLRRYIVRVVDPVAGRAITVANLEPDYIEELKRFVSVEELGCYVLDEQELRMPGLWKESMVTLQIATANEAGTSQWSVVKIPLTAPATPLAVPTIGFRQQSPPPQPRTECQPTFSPTGHLRPMHAAAAVRIGAVG